MCHLSLSSSAEPWTDSRQVAFSDPIPITATQGRLVEWGSGEAIRTNTPERATDFPSEDQSALGTAHHPALSANGASTKLSIFPMRRSIRKYSATRPQPCWSSKSCVPARTLALPKGRGGGG